MRESSSTHSSPSSVPLSATARNRGSVLRRMHVRLRAMREREAAVAPSIPTPCAREACKGTLLRDSDGDITCHQCGRPAVPISPADAYAMKVEVERGGKRRREPIVGGVYGR